MTRSSLLDMPVRWLAPLMPSRVPFRRPEPPFDSPAVFEKLGVTGGGAPHLTFAPIELQSGPEHERVPFAFTSRVTTEWPEANTVHGELYLLPGRPAAPTCVLIHGNGPRSPIYERYRARQLLRAGVHAASFCWAGHMKRIPASERTAEHTLAADVAGCVQTFVQSATDAADLVRWLRAQPFATEIGMAGWSGGGITTMLALSLVDVDFALPVVPAVDLAFVLWGPYIPGVAQKRLRQFVGSLDELREMMAAILAARHQPRMPKRFLLLPAAYDEICGVEPTRAAWKAWGRPPIEWLPHGHIMGAIDRRVGTRLVELAIGPR